MNTYVYRIDDGYVMIDTGYENSFKTVCRKLSKYNISLNEIKCVFLTHAHDDHAGFLKEMMDKSPNLKVIASEKAIPVLIRGQNSFDGGCSSLLALIFCNIMKLFGKGEHKFPPIENEYLDKVIHIKKIKLYKLTE